MSADHSSSCVLLMKGRCMTAMCILLQETDGETHSHAPVGRGRAVCALQSRSETFGSLSPRLHCEDILHRHAEGIPKSKRTMLMLPCQ